MTTTNQQKNDALFWLNVSFKVQAFISLMILFPMLFPKHFAQFIPGWKQIEIESHNGCIYSMHIGASIMSSAPILSIWANQKPFERKDILLILCIPAFGFAVSHIFSFIYLSLINGVQLFLHLLMDFLIIFLHLFAYNKGTKFISTQKNQ